MSKYDDWITLFEISTTLDVKVYPPASTKEEHVSIALRGRCGYAVDKMMAEFPELRKVRGHYRGTPHWWCVTPDGTIVDPTAKQFKPGGEYVEYNGPDPVGKCMNCGDYVWSMEFGSNACSKECMTELEAYYR